MFKANNENTRTISLTSFKVEQVNVSWKVPNFAKNSSI